ncbi:Thioredoxin [Desulfamplus magnetovallimortis]|uniref:Thioredoxin n=1 Tax=Desulfamplus magnetovallimortis TaxID=1246637 RepID=A0A1W1HBF2_9BACT|nr:thioredoxin domain-containing protein [Desulfamplus magnetovallimortis]SLM29773.1 Thioredoxin [Desulfamplus magnetovallimortis]
MDMDIFHRKVEKGVSLVDFSALWCAPCKAQKPIIDGLIKKFKGNTSIIEMDIDKNRELAEKYMIQSIPTLILFKNGREIKRFVGIQTEATLSNSLNQAIESLDDISCEH